VTERIWTKEKDEALVILHRAGHTYNTIAAGFGITLNAAAARIAVLIRAGVLKARSENGAARRQMTKITHLLASNDGALAA
jgi:3-methyladenine DNA glycosylase Mpg